MAMQMVASTMPFFERQLEDDSDHEEGQYYFHMRPCPRSDEEATRMRVQILDELQESEEDDCDE